jgi:hypothetical protein
MRTLWIAIGILLALAAAAAAYKIARRYRAAVAPPPPPAPAAVEPKAPVLPVRPPQVIENMKPLEGYILDWLGDGPYAVAGKDGRALFDLPFPPETPGAKGAFWKPVIRGIGVWEIDLTDALGVGDHCAGYLRTRVWAPAAQNALLELGSDVGVKAWLNGEVVHANNAQRGLAPCQDIVDVKLREGWNELLLKITNCGAAWACCCRLRKPDGTAIEGVKISIE